MSAPVMDPPQLARSQRVDAVSRRHRGRLLVVLLALVVLGAVASLAIGSRPLSPGTVLDVLFHDDRSDVATIVHALRVPRTVLAIAVGAALGVAGALMQGHTRNPLADPGLLGVEAGASCAVVIGIFAFGVEDVSGYAWFALAGAGLAAAAVFAIGSTRRGPDPVSLVLAGAAVSAFLAAITSRLEEVVRALPHPDSPGGYVWVAGESRALRGVRRYLRREPGLPASRYRAVGYWIERAEEWNQRYDALDQDTRRSLEAMWSEDRPEEDIECDYDERLAALGL